MGQSKDQYAADTRLQKLREMPLIRNANNVVHSCENGLLVDIVRVHWYRMRVWRGSDGDCTRCMRCSGSQGLDKNTGQTQGMSYNPKDASGAFVEAKFENVIAYKNHGFGIWTRGSYHVISNALLMDNRVGTFTPGVRLAQCVRGRAVAATCCTLCVYRGPEPGD
jgi:hypothetical protein